MYREWSPLRTADLIPNVARSLHHDRDSEKSYGSLVMDRSHDPTRGTYLSHHPIITRFFNPGKNLVPPNRIRPKRNGASDVDNDLLTSVANAPLDDIHQSINIRGPTLFLISTWEMKSLHQDAANVLRNTADITKRFYPVGSQLSVQSSLSRNDPIGGPFLGSTAVIHLNYHISYSYQVG